MNIEPANKSMECFSIYYETYKLTGLFSKIPFTFIFSGLYISFSQIIHTKTSSEKEVSRQIPNDMRLFILILLMTIACFYTFKDISYNKVIGVLRKCCRRLIFTFFWAFFMGAIYTPVALGLLVWFLKGVDDLRLLDPDVTGLNFMLVVWNVANLVTVLENNYGIKGLAKSMRLNFGKMWISCAVYGLLEITVTGIILPFCYLVVFGNKMNFWGRGFVKITCLLLTIIWIHFSVVRLTVVYLVCKSYHNEDITTANHALVVPIIYLIWLVIQMFI